MIKLKKEEHVLYVTVCKGLPASGKSTWAKEMVRKSAGTIKRINRDDLRAMIDAGEWSSQNEKIIIESRNVLLETYLRKGFNVIIDDTNFRNDNWISILKLVERLNIDCVVTEQCFPIDLQEAIERDSKRLGSAKVGESVIKKMWKENIAKNSEALRPRSQRFSRRSAVLQQNESLPKAIICDLDGTLAIMGHRSPYDASKCDSLDYPNAPVVEAVRLFHEAGYKILFVSGREDKDREPTSTFISKHLPGVSGELWMRKTHDTRQDTVVKKEIWNDNIAGKYNVLCCIDDRSSVVAMWRHEIGLPVFQVADGNF